MEGVEEEDKIGGINVYFRHEGEEYTSELEITKYETAESMSIKVSNTAFALISKMVEVGAIKE